MRFGVIYLLKKDVVAVQPPESGALGVLEEVLSDPVELDVAFG